jgi:hypothetical protein
VLSVKEEATVANLVGKTILSGALMATLVAPAWAQIQPDLPLFTGDAVFIDPYNELLDHMMPKKLRASVFPMAQTVAVDVQFGPRLADLDAYNATLAVLADRVRRKADAMSAYAFVPGNRTPRVQKAPIPFDK